MLQLLDDKDTILENIQNSGNFEYRELLYSQLNTTEFQIKIYKKVSKNEICNRTRYHCRT